MPLAASRGSRRPSGRNRNQKEPEGGQSMGVLTQTGAFIPSVVGIINGEDSTNTHFLCVLCGFFFFLISFNINSMKAFPKLSNDVAQGRSFSLWFQSAELVGETIPSLISIAVH